jgi:hypothetical protein
VDNFEYATSIPREVASNIKNKKKDSRSADISVMPRLQRQTATKPSLAQELRTLYGQLLAGERQALERAHDIGKLLAPLAVAERNALCRAAEFSERLWRLYIHIHENWRAILAARCQSIRQAERLLRKRKPSQAPPFLWPDWPEIRDWFEREALEFNARRRPADLRAITTL